MYVVKTVTQSFRHVVGLTLKEVHFAIGVHTFTFVICYNRYHFRFFSFSLIYVSMLAMPLKHYRMIYIT
jgi:hypothetical protein